MKIEDLRREDLAQYKALIDACFGESNSLEKYKSGYDKKGSCKIMVVKEKDKIVASMTICKIELFTFDFQPCLELFNVATLPASRGKGYSRALFDYVLSYAKANHYKSISLTCLESAKEAHRLYESMGFVKMDRYKYSMYFE